MAGDRFDDDGDDDDDVRSMTCRTVSIVPSTKSSPWFVNHNQMDARHEEMNGPALLPTRTVICFRKDGLTFDDDVVDETS